MRSVVAFFWAIMDDGSTLKLYADAGMLGMLQKSRSKVRFSETLMNEFPQGSEEKGSRYSASHGT